MLLSLVKSYREPHKNDPFEYRKELQFYDEETFVLYANILGDNFKDLWEWFSVDLNEVLGHAFRPTEFLYSKTWKLARPHSVFYDLGRPPWLLPQGMLQDGL